MRQETAAFALTEALGPRRSLLVINRVDVETRPFALTRSFVVGDAVCFKLVPPCAGPKIARLRDARDLERRIEVAGNVRRWK